MCAQQRWTGTAGKGGRQRRQKAAAAIDADHLEAVAGEAAADQIAEKALPFGGALACRQAEIDHLLLAVGAQPESDQDRPPDRAGAGLAGQHDPVEHEHAVALFEGPGMKGGDHRIELFGHRAHRRGADRPPQDRQQRLADPRFREGRLLRTERPSTKQARIMRSSCSARRA